MDQNKYIEVRIFEPVPEDSAFNNACEYSIKTLSTIHECDNSKVSCTCAHKNAQRDGSCTANMNSNAENFSFSKQRTDSARSSDAPIDIDLLLRYYACNSNMEKSINKLLVERDDQVWKTTDEGPLVELGTVYKICSLLKDSSSGTSLLSTFRFYDVLTKLQSLMHRCSKETLNEILSNDPSMKLCKHCGVISCVKPRSVPVELRKSLHRTSYFLGTQLTSDDDKSEVHRRTNKVSLKKERTMKRAEKHQDVQKDTDYSVRKQHRDNEKTNTSRKIDLILKRENNYGNSNNNNNNDDNNSNNFQQIEPMVAERENDNKFQEAQPMQNAMCKRMLEADTTKLQNHLRNSQVIKLPSERIAKGNLKYRMSEQIQTTPNFKDRHKTKSDDNSNLLNKLPFDKYFNQASNRNEFTHNKRNEQKTSIKDQLSFGSNEKVMKDILYEKSKTHLDQQAQSSRAPLSNRQSIGSKQNEATNAVIEATATIDLMSYLERGHVRSSDGRKKELISQSDRRTRAPSKHPSERSFVLYNSEDRDPNRTSEFLLHGKLLTSSKNARNENLRSSSENLQNRLERYKNVKPVQDVQQFDSTTCVVEDDSLENCVDASRTLELPIASNTTVFSSSSAENMIREWVKTPESSKESGARSERSQSLYTLKPSIVGLNVDPEEFWINEKCAYYANPSSSGPRDLRDHDTNRTSSPIFSRTHTKPYHPDEQTLPPGQAVNGNFKFWNSQESIKEKANTSSSKKIKTGGSKRCLGKYLFGSFKSIKSINSMKCKDVVSNTIKSSVPSGNGSAGNRVKNISRRIIYKQSSLKDAMDSVGRCNKMDDILSFYRKILENTEEMSWECFQRFVEDLHPNQKDTWRNICESIDNEVRKMADEKNCCTEICIEIARAPLKGAKQERKRCSNEIAFEMDITLGDVESCLARQLPSAETEQLDNLERASEASNVRNDVVCGIQVLSNQVE